MKRIFVSFLLLFGVLPVFAQNAAKVEVFGGYQYLGYDINGADGRVDLKNGWDLELARAVSKNVSAVADFSGSSKTETASSSGITATGKLHVYNFLFGPRLFVTKGVVTPFAEILFGIQHTSVSASAMGVTESESNNGLALALGGGVDLSLNRHFAIRAAKVDYLWNKFNDGGLNSGKTLSNLRVSTGVVVKF